MSKPESILTDAEMHALICGNPSTLGLSIARLKDLIRQVEKAVVAKLAEQEPIVEIDCNGDTVCPKKHSLKLLDLGTKLYAHPMPSPSDVSDKTACVSKPEYCETQHYTVRCNYCWWHGGEDDLDLAVATDYPEDGVCKVCPQCKQNGCLMDLDHNKQQMDLAKELYGATKDRSSDSTNRTKLSLSIDTKETQALLQSYLDDLKDWQLVPKEPTPEMIQASDESDKEYSKRNFNADVRLCQSGYDHYLVMLAAAPKYTGDSNE